MSSSYNVGKPYNLTKTDGLPPSCSVDQKESILLNALDSSNSDQRYAAVQRLNELDKITPRIKEKLFKLLAKEADSFVLSALAKLFANQNIQEGLIGLIKKYNPSSINETYLYALEELVNGPLTEEQQAALVPVLQEAFKYHPSDGIALALLKLGDHRPYLENFAKDDLDLLDEPDSLIKYKDPLWWILFGGGFRAGFVAAFGGANPSNPTSAPMPDQAGGAPGMGGLNPNARFNTKRVLTSASYLKPIARNNLALLIGTAAKNKDRKIIPFLFRILAKYPPVDLSAKYPQKKKIIPVARKIIAAALNTCATKEDIPYLFSILKKSPDHFTIMLVLDHLGEQIRQGKLDGKTNEKTLKGMRALLDNKTVRGKAIKVLAGVGEKRIIPKLVEIINSDAYCSLEVMALAKLQTSPGFYPVDPALFGSTYLKVLNNRQYADDARVNAAAALAYMGKRDGIKVLIDGLYDVLTNFAADSSPQKTQYLGEALEKIIKPQDVAHLERFINSSHPGLILIGLELAKKIRDPQAIPWVTARLQDKSFNVRAFTSQLRSDRIIQAQLPDLKMLKSKIPNPDAFLRYLEGFLGKFADAFSDPEVKTVPLEALAPLIAKYKEIYFAPLNQGKIEETKNMVRFNALLTLASIRHPGDAKTLAVIKKEIDHWKSYLQEKQAKHDALSSIINEGRPIQVPHAVLAPEEYALPIRINTYLPPLNRYVRQSEWVIKTRGPILNVSNLNIEYSF